MRITLLSIFLAAIIAGCQNPPTESDSSTTVVFNQALADELDSIMVVDQIAAGIPQGAYSDYSPEEWQAFKDSVFSLHKSRALEILDEIGFPGFDLVGENGSRSFWLIAQHADHDPVFQQVMLDSMKRQLDQNNVDPAHYAYLTDRILANAGDLQIYGTQVDYNFEICQAFPKNGLQDSAAVNELREKVGLESLEEYLNSMSEGHYIMNKSYFEERGVEGPTLYETPVSSSEKEE